MESSTLAVRTKGVSPYDVITNEKRDGRATSPKQDSRCQRPNKLSKQYRHTPYDRSPGGSTCTSSDESTNGDDEEMGTEQKRLKRMAANCRERKRMHTVNSAFDELRELVPTYPSNRKLSKIDTLRLACAYIEDLTALLRNPGVVHGEDVKLYHPEGFGSPPSTGYPVKTEYSVNGDFSNCSYQQYRVPPSYFSDCTSEYSPSESETNSPPYVTQNCQPGIAVRPPAFTRTNSDSAVAAQLAQATIGTTVCGQIYHSRQLPPNCSPLATVQHTSALMSTNVPSPPETHLPPVWQRTASLPYCLYRQ